jgi:hypothetical protein
VTTTQELSNELTGRSGEERRVTREPEVEIVEASPIVCNVNKDMATLYGKMAIIMGIVGSVARDGTNAHFNYKFQRSDDVYNAVRKAMAEQKIAFFCSMTEVSRTGKITYATFQFTLACGDTGATMTSQWHGEAMDSGDKGINKVATAATKYFLLKTFLIGDPGEVDPDSESGIPETSSKTKRPTPSADTKPDAPNENNAASNTPEKPANLPQAIVDKWEPAMAFMYPKDEGGFHRRGTLKQMYDDGILTEDTPGGRMLELVLERRAFRNENMLLSLNMVFQELSKALDDGTEITSWADWYGKVIDRKPERTIQEAWDVLKAYAQHSKDQPAKAKTEQAMLPGTPPVDVPF